MAQVYTRSVFRDIMFRRTLTFQRWIESERADALLGKSQGDGVERNVRHVDEAFLAFGSGPRVCPGQVSIDTLLRTFLLMLSSKLLLVQSLCPPGRGLQPAVQCLFSVFLPADK